MAFELPPLPYSKLPSRHGMCQETLELHHGKHHQAYVTALNGFVEKDPRCKASRSKRSSSCRTARPTWRRCSTMPASTGTTSCSGRT